MPESLAPETSLKKLKGAKPAKLSQTKKKITEGTDTK
jgi:hypothetical protein